MVNPSHMQDLICKTDCETKSTEALHMVTKS